MGKKVIQSAGVDVLKVGKSRSPFMLCGFECGCMEDADVFCRLFIENNPNVSMRDVARVSRWRGHMMEFSLEMKNIPGYKNFVLCDRALFDNFGVSAVSVAIDSMCKTRGIYSCVRGCDNAHKMIDEMTESGGKRHRDNEERVTARCCLTSVLNESMSSYFPQGDMAVEFIRKWWREGDTSVSDAIRRALDSVCT